MAPIIQMLLTNKNRPKLKIIKLKGIVVHWTANEGVGSDADNNRNYFNTTTRSCSAHYIVDDNKIVQCVPDDEIAYHVGNKTYKPAGQAMIENGRGPNYFTIGIEMCVNKDGVWSKTYANTVGLVVMLLRKYNLTIHQLFRHYDITGKDCPRMMLSEVEWTKFKLNVQSKLNAQTIKKGEVIATKLNCRATPDANGEWNGTLKQGAPVNIYEERNGWYLVNKTFPQWVYGIYVKIL